MELEERSHRLAGCKRTRPGWDEADDSVLRGGGRRISVTPDVNGKSGLPNGCNLLPGIASVERVFCSQTLTTPAGCSEPRTEEQADARADDGRERALCFTISYSQTYSRTSSQVEAEEAAGEAPRVAPAMKGPACALQRADGAAGRDVLTPDLGSDCTSPTALAQRKALFPIFRPRSQWKTVHLIRHGESEYNAATNLSKSFADPQIFDPGLTERGRKQARALQVELERMRLPASTLWVVSPLTRALDTLMLGCPQLAAMPGREDAGAEAHDAPVAPCVVVSCELSEHLQTTGDIGMPSSALARKYPQFQAQLQDIPERWWFRPDVNDAVGKRMGKWEPKKAMQERVRLFRQWLQAQPDKVIVAVGHSCMFRELIGPGDKRLKNCEVYTMRI